MPYKVTAGVIGCVAQPSIPSSNRSLEEILFDITQSVLGDAGLGVADIDGIVVAANDQYDGRAISIMAASGSVGGVNRDILSTPSASEHAFVLGALRVSSGQYRTQLVLAWSPTEVGSIPEAQRLAADPYFHRQLPLDELASHALQASALEARLPNLRALARVVTEKNRRHGARAYPGLTPDTAGDGKPPPWPLERGAIAPPVTGAVALVLASEHFIRERGIVDVAWIRGMGWSTEPSFLGDRDLAHAPSLTAAANRAYEEAGISKPAAAIDLAEVADATPYQELLAYEGLGFCGRDEWKTKLAEGAFAQGGRLPVNLSGGATTFNPVFCTGLLRIAESANQVRGRAGAHQASNVATAVAQAASGFAMQYQSVIVLAGENAGAAS